MDVLKSPPHIADVEEIFPEQIRTEKMNSNVRLRFIYDDEFPTIRLSLKFAAGSWFEQNNQLLAVNVARMAKTGTQDKDAAQISQAIDLTGGKLIFQCYEDHAWVNISCLENQLQNVLQIAEEIFYGAAFPEDELDVLKKQLIQKLKVNNSKTDYVAQKHFFASVFGPEHPYGYYSTEQAIQALDSNLMLDFFQKHYTSEQLELVGTGKFDAQHIQRLNAFVDNLRSNKKPGAPTHQIIADAQKMKSFEVKNANQASVVVGCKALQRNHPDYIPYSIMITLLGGYFGSRLMMNLREEKGLTYGVYAQILNYKYDSCLMIQADVNKEAADQAIDEIFFEIEKLKLEKVKQDELSNMKQYLSGNLLGLLDGKLKQFVMLKQIVSYDLSEAFIYDYFHAVKKITPEEIQQMAIQYLNRDDFFIMKAH